MLKKIFEKKEMKIVFDFVLRWLKVKILTTTLNLETTFIVNKLICGVQRPVDNVFNPFRELFDFRENCVSVDIAGSGSS